MEILKQALRVIVPKPLQPAAYLQNLVRTRSNLCVDSGPFKGLRYVGESVGSALYPKLIGIYEKELWPILARIASLDFNHAIDIGAAEGYYAVGLVFAGLARRLTAFEETAAGQALIGEMAQRNGVADRITIKGRCEPRQLSAELDRHDKPILIVCDVEGYEAVLMDPLAVPGLKDAFILVELHEFVQRGISQVLRERFKSSHTMVDVFEQPRLKTDLPYSTFYSRLVPERYFWTVISEYRPERMNWLWLEPLGGSRGRGQ